MDNIVNIINSRRKLLDNLPTLSYKKTLEGGCGVVGVIASEPILGKYIIRPCRQMRNRGNGKGGGIAALGVFPEFKEHYAIHIAYIDESIQKDLEEDIFNTFDVVHWETQKSLKDHREVGLTIKPPKVVRYFSKVKENILTSFMKENNLEDREIAEDEFVYQNSFRINLNYYSKPKAVQAFVLSHGKDIMVLKGVGYAEEICEYYLLQDIKAYGWIGHQRYPTRGRVWHPGGAHPFVGLNEALVHNGDFANYYAITEYLRQRNIFPLFITDTEVSALLFDLYSRVYNYPLEFVIEALAPTTERDFEMLPKKKQRIYRAIKNSHIHGSPDGPWFFIILRNNVKSKEKELIGITDTSMLRPQVFAFQKGKIDIGIIASEKQAIDGLLEELSYNDGEILPIADLYWNARGGSYSDGGAFIFTLKEENNKNFLLVTDKFGKEIVVPKNKKWENLKKFKEVKKINLNLQEINFFQDFGKVLKNSSFDEIYSTIYKILKKGESSDLEREKSIKLLTQLRDRRYNTYDYKRSFLLSIIDNALDSIFLSIEYINEKNYLFSRIDREVKNYLVPPTSNKNILLIDAKDFDIEGENSVARLIVNAYQLGWKRFIVFRCKGDRFIGCGLGPKSEGVTIDVYGSSGDYLGSGIDGAEIYVHNNAQDQVGQILKSGKIVIYGDVGQTFLYGAKGGTAYVLGNAAGRPLINAVGNIRTIINGTCLDYCAESFMAGSEIDGGFVIINGIKFDEFGNVIGLEIKYPGSNFFSLASGGTGYLNDPYYTITEMQLNGAKFTDFTQDDWNVILPYLQENERLFGISIRSDLLTVDGVIKWPKEVFRKVVASKETQTLDWSSLPL